jgi:hypothetical protein
MGLWSLHSRTCSSAKQRVHSKAADAVRHNFTAWHGICSGMLKMEDRNVLKMLGSRCR